MASENDMMQQVFKETKDLIRAMEGTATTRVAIGMGEYSIEVERDGSAFTTSVVPMAAPAASAGGAAPATAPGTMAVVAPDERSAAAGVTGIARSIGAAVAPAISGALLAGAMTFSAPFFIAGGLKIVYDLLLYRSFKATKPPEEQAARGI